MVLWKSRLEEIGEPALDALYKAADSDDADDSRREVLKRRRERLEGLRRSADYALHANVPEPAQPRGGA